MGNNRISMESSSLSESANYAHVSPLSSKQEKG